MQRWEYKIEEYLSEDSFNDLGDEGWELVAIAATMASAQYIFKRAKTQTSRS